MKFIGDEITQFLVKTILPACIIITMRLAAESRRKKINWPYAFTSFVMGIGAAVLVDEPIRHAIQSDAWATSTIVASAIMADKIMNWFLYRFKFDVIGDVLIEALKDFLRKMLK